MQEHISRHVLDALEWPALIEKLASRCRTSRGRDFSSRIAPLDADDARSRMSVITALKDLYRRGESADFSGVSDVEPHARRAGKGATLSLDELFDLRQFSRACVRVATFLENSGEEFPSLDPLLEGYRPMDSLAEELGSSITDDKALSTARYPSLRRMRDTLFEARQEAEKRISRMIHNQSVAEILQEAIHTTVNGRYVLLVKTGMKNRVPGTVHDVSASGATLYLEPDEVRPFNDRIIIAERELAMEIERILQQLSAMAGDRSADILEDIGFLASADFHTAAAVLSTDTRSTGLEICDRGEITLYAARHPLLELLNPGGVVANDILLGTDSLCMVISGANTGGKTVLLKTIGLAVLMALHGLHVPAGPDSRVGIFSRIMADIGDDQNLEQSLSTFSGQMMIIRDMVEKADDRTLLLIDEIVVGTSPRQGAALARAVLEELARTEARIVVTTHYPELKEMASSGPLFRNASVSFDMDTLRPTYHLVTGLPGASYALEIARLCGLPAGILDRAAELVDSTERSIEALIEETQRFRQELEGERNRIRELESELAADRRKIAEKERKLQEMKHEMSMGGGIRFLEELASMRGHVNARMTSLQDSTMREAQDIREEIDRVESRVRGSLEKQMKERHRAMRRSLTPEKTVPGTRVFIIPLEKEGVIESVQGADITVRLGSLRSRYRQADLLEAQGSSGPSPAERKKKSREEIIYSLDEGEIPYTYQTQYNTIDLRGKRVEEGLADMAGELDRMSRMNIPAVVVIHGHGTGAMKVAVRSALPMSPYCHDFRPGRPEEGGDGVTIIRMKM